MNKSFIYKYAGKPPNNEPIFSQLTKLNKAEEITQLKARIAELEQDDKVCKVVEDAEYFYFDCSDDACLEDTFIFDDDGLCNSDRGRIEQGNAFPTREACERDIRVRKVHYELTKLAHKLNDGVEIDWEDGEQRKHYMCLIVGDSIQEYWTFTELFIATIYCLDDNFYTKSLELFTDDQLVEYLTWYGKPVIWEE